MYLVYDNVYNPYTCFTKNAILTLQFTLHRELKCNFFLYTGYVTDTERLFEKNKQSRLLLVLYCIYKYIESFQKHQQYCSHTLMAHIYHIDKNKHTES